MKSIVWPSVLKTLPRLLKFIKLVAVIDILLSRAISYGIVEFTLDTTTFRSIVVARSSVEDVIFERSVRDTHGFVEYSAAETGYWVEKFGFFNLADVEFFGPYGDNVNILPAMVDE